MKVVKNINNNVAICEDSAGNEVVAFAKGIGFKKPPYDIDIKDVERTFYHVDKRYLDLIENADEKIVDVAMSIRDKTIEAGLFTGTNLLFSLIDHISFAIERQNKGIQFTLPIKDDIRFKFPEEMEIGKYALDLISKRLKVTMPKDEACYIALNIVNSETEASQRQERELRTIEEITEMISADMGIEISRESINYSRFGAHMHYLLKKTQFNKEDNYPDLLNTMKAANPEAYECALHIKGYLEEQGYGVLTGDEVLFLTLHVTRLCQRESE